VKKKKDVMTEVRESDDRDTDHDTLQTVIKKEQTL
jgi:hypothetical protein